MERTVQPSQRKHFGEDTESSGVDVASEQLQRSECFPWPYDFLSSHLRAIPNRNRENASKMLSADCVFNTKYCQVMDTPKQKPLIARILHQSDAILPPLSKSCSPDASRKNESSPQLIASLDGKAYMERTESVSCNPIYRTGRFIDPYFTHSSVIPAVRARESAFVSGRRALRRAAGTPPVPCNFVGLNREAAWLATRGARSHTDVRVAAGTAASPVAGGTGTLARRGEKLRPLRADEIIKMVSHWTEVR